MTGRFFICLNRFLFNRYNKRRVVPLVEKAVAQHAGFFLIKIAAVFQ